MCGIAGISAPAGTETSRLEAALDRMVAFLRHRGPDDEGRETIQDGAAQRSTVLLGHTRLAILDLSEAGHEPMHDPETGNWIVLNGEIYNHREVRRALGDRAGSWRSRTDTETVLRAYGAWGPACVDRLRGMFAMALWDARAGALWCARDRLGIKPFHYWAERETFVFASEVRALLASGLVPRKVDPGGLAGFVRFGSVPEPLTLVRGVASLPAGSWMRVRAGRVEETRAYWKPEPSATEVTPDDAAREIRAHLERAVREHLLSDVPVACFLSGGIDSSVVTALAACACGGPLRTLTVGFREAEFDESGKAQAVASRCGTEHRRILLSDGEVASRVPEAVRAMDQPSADGVNTYLVSRAAAEAGIKVVLSGLGGDELFGGYRSFRLLRRAERWAPVLGRVPAPVRRLAAGGGGSGERAAEMTGANVPLRDRYEALRSFWSERELEGMGAGGGVGYGTDDPGPSVPVPTRVCLLELGGYMKSTLLRDSDVMSMAHSLELRVPFLDHELVDCCLRTEAAGRMQGRGSKAVLLQAAGDLLPPGVADRPKQGFMLPMDGWMRGGLRRFVADGLDRLAEAGVLAGVDVDDLSRRFDSGRLQWARLWEFVVLGCWLDAQQCVR